MAPRTPHRSAWLLAAAALLAGCPNAGTAPMLDPSASPSAAGTATPGASALPASAAPTTAASVAPGASPAATPAATTTPTPAVSAPPPAAGATVTVNGSVFNEEGSKLDGVSIEVKSLNPAVPFTATLVSTNGHYVVNGVPVGTQVQFTATKAGHTSRTLVESFQTNDLNAKTVNFGNSSPTAANSAFFLSDYPELVSATAGDSTKGLKLNYVLKFSEAFDETNKSRIEDALAITATPRAGTVTTISIKKGSTFLDASKRVVMTWNAANDTLTVAFDAPLQGLRTDTKAYSVGLTRPTGSEPIKDNNGKVLGFITPTASQPYPNISKKSNLTLASTDTTAQKRWEATHSRTSSFEVVKDEERPKLSSVQSSTVTTTAGTFLRLELTYNEPMVVYPDATGFSSTILDRNNYVLVFTRKTNGTNGIDMSKTATDRNDAATTLNNLTASMDSETPFRLIGTATGTSVTITKSNSNPNVIFYDIPKALIPSDLKQVRIRASIDILDPVGNRMSEAGKDANTLIQDNVKDAII